MLESLDPNKPIKKLFITHHFNLIRSDTAMKKRTSPSQLVTASARSKVLNWYARLPLRDRKYIDEVVDAMVVTPDSPIYVVARDLVKELSLTVNSETVARKLREMMVNAAQETR